MQSLFFHVFKFHLCRMTYNIAVDSEQTAPSPITFSFKVFGEGGIIVGAFIISLQAGELVDEAGPVPRLKLKIEDVMI
jgi:hypothetical protein